MTWFLFTTEPKREIAAEKICLDRGITALVPRLEVWTRNSGPKRIKQLAVRPMLPGYLFANLVDPTAGFHAVRSVKGVRGILGARGIPYPVLTSEVERMAAMSHMEIKKFHEVPQIFTPGTKAQISAGPFAGHVVEVASIRGNNAKILLKLFGTSQEAEIALEHLEAA